MSNSTTENRPERTILTRLFAAQRRLRFVRGLERGLRWFAAGSAVSVLALVVLWNWDRLPGPWQWLAAAGRPQELLWLPFLVALGGFASCWAVLPSVRETAYKLDLLRGSQERLLTAVDWILSEKPRTAVSGRLLDRAASDLEDERRLSSDLRQLERVSKKSYALLATLLLPIALLYVLPPNVGLPDSAAVWLAPAQIERLAEALEEELAKAPAGDDPEKGLKELLKELARNNPSENVDAKASEAETRRELQKALDRMEQAAKGQESARQLLESLAQRARAGQGLSPEDKAALDALREKLGGAEAKSTLEKASSDWESGDGEKAAEALETLQKETGEAAQSLEQAAADGKAQSEALPSPEAAGQEFDEGQGDQQPGEGKPDGPGRGNGQGEGLGVFGKGPGEGLGDFGKGTTEEDEGGEGGGPGKRSPRQSGRTSTMVEETKHLHPPVRNEMATSQTRVRGAKGKDGERYRTDKEGRGAVTEPARISGGGGLLEYRESAENALLREEIPADSRDQVRLYFEALDR